MSSVCGSMANKSEAKCHSNCASSHTTSDSSQAISRTSENCKCIGVPTIRGKRVSKLIPNLTQSQANKIYSDVVSVIRDRWSEEYTIPLPIPTATTPVLLPIYHSDGTPKGHSLEEIPTKWEWKKVPVCCRKLYDEEPSLKMVAKKYFEIQSKNPKAPFEYILKDLRFWATEGKLKE